MKRKLEIFAVVNFIAAIVGIIVFWFAGFNGQLEISKYSFFAAGPAGWLFLITRGIIKLRERNFCMD